jgi:hypothetical protein
LIAAQMTGVFADVPIDTTPYLPARFQVSDPCLSLS